MGLVEVTRPIARQLAGIPTGAYAVIADRIRVGDLDAWDWHLSRDDIRTFNIAVECNAAAKLTERQPDGSLRLLGTFFQQRGVRAMTGSSVASRTARLAQEGGATGGQSCATIQALTGRSGTFLGQTGVRRDGTGRADAWARAERVLGGPGVAQGGRGVEGPVARSEGVKP